MQYRGFNIYTSVPSVIDRWNILTRAVEPHVGVYCEVYDVHDVEHADCLETFQLVIDDDIPDLHTESIEKAIRAHVDAYNMYLNLCRNEAMIERKNALIGDLASRLGVTLEPGELYDLLSENVGMSDEEIRACGFVSLAPHFDREAYAQTIAEYMIQVGTENTTTGNWHFGFDTISERFGVDLMQDAEMVSLIENALYERGDMLSQIDIFDNDFDLMFYLNCCPFSDRDDPAYQIEDDTDNAVSIRKEDDTAMKTQKITAELPTPRYRALHYYLEKEGKAIESELRKHLEQMYRDQVPKDVQEYMQSLHPELEQDDAPDEHARTTKRQRVSQKNDTVVADPVDPVLSM